MLYRFTLGKIALGKKQHCAEIMPFSEGFIILQYYIADYPFDFVLILLWSRTKNLGKLIEAIQRHAKKSALKHTNKGSSTLTHRVYVTYIDWSIFVKAHGNEFHESKKKKRFSIIVGVCSWENSP